jgi:outer membrane lipase/esterase
VGPRLGLHYRHTTINDFRERSRNAIGCIANFGGGTTCTPLTGTGLELAFDSQKEDSLRAAAGVFLARAVSLGFGIVVPQATVEYVHEFLRDQRQIRFRFVEDNAFRTKFRFENDPPDRDYINASAGLVFVLPRGISPYVNYTGLFGYSAQHRHAVTAGVRVEF